MALICVVIFVMSFIAVFLFVVETSSLSAPYIPSVPELAQEPPPPEVEAVGVVAPGATTPREVALGVAPARDNGKAWPRCADPGVQKPPRLPTRAMGCFWTIWLG